MNKEDARKELFKLLEHLKSESASGKLDYYQEEETKNVFILPLLGSVLGWDYTRRDEVGAEHATSKGRVDYSLKIDGNIKLFVETKPVGDDITRHVDQALKYGKNYDRVPFILLTNFKRLMLFDVWYGKKNKGLKLDLQWDKYLTEFDKLWLLSRESVKSGALDDLLLQKPKGRKLAEKIIVRDLLGDFLKWRNELATNIFKNNPDLFHSGALEKDSAYLKEITQKILDRIIFIRFCEDRGLAQGKSLGATFSEREYIVGAGAMRLLKGIFSSYWRLFNSDLFKPQKWEDDLATDFKVINKVILKTYDDYLFDVIPIEVLGSIYEQYLGHDLRVTDHRVKHEIKPALRKTKGAYYTPEYIVNYIVENTVAKTLKQSSAARTKEIKILDPACGSGSFLIRAYEELLKYYRSEKKAGKKYDKRQGNLGMECEKREPILSLDEKSEILLNHIFGVDIDEQAVELTKLSLILKMLEGERGIISGRAILPILNRNIKCGNSLIGHDYFKGKLAFMSEDDEKRERRSIKPFDWNSEFSEIMTEGGFDCVIGNPPYDIIKEDDYLKKSIAHGTGNLFGHFIARSSSLVKNDGFFSFVVPLSFSCGSDYENIRRHIYSKFGNLTASHYSIRPAKLFPNVDQRITIFVANGKSDNRGCNISSSRLYRFNDGEQEDVVSNPEIGALGHISQGYIPRVANKVGASIYKKFKKIDSTIGDYVLHNSNVKWWFHSVARYWIKAYNFIPFFKREYKSGISTNLVEVNVDSEDIAIASVGLINSNLFYFWWIAQSDEFHVLRHEVFSMPFPKSLLSDQKLFTLVEYLMKDYKEKVVRKKIKAGGKKIVMDEIHARLSRGLILEIDNALAGHYNLTKEELNFLKNYDIKFRLSEE